MDIFKAITHLYANKNNRVKSVFGVTYRANFNTMKIEYNNPTCMDKDRWLPSALIDFDNMLSYEFTVEDRTFEEVAKCQEN